MYLLDTNVISELRIATKGIGDRPVVAWANGVPDKSLFLSVISILELEIGTLQMERRDRVQGAMLRWWMENRVMPSFEGRILPLDTEVARRCAALHVPDPRSERDAMIAATAIVHGMTVVTRNVVHFAGTGVAILNPWQA